jgi:cytochrome c-type biogenesis protein
MQKSFVPRNKQSVFYLFLLLLFVFFFRSIPTGNCVFVNEHEYVVFGEGCYQCFVEYVTELQEMVGITNSSLRVEYLDSNYIARNELNLLYEDLKVPSEYRGSVVVSMDEKFLFINYVQIDSINEFLKNSAAEESKFIVYWDELKGVYTIIDENGDIYECKDISLTKCTEQAFTINQNTLILVLFSGILDGINPCAFTVLVFMVTILYTLQSFDEEKSNLTLTVGSFYIIAVYIGYLAIGLAVFKIIMISGAQKLLAQLGALLLILLGIVNVRDSITNGKPALSIPDWAWSLIKSNIRKASIPAAFIAGLIVSVVEFPCTGGVYLSIMGMLASETSYRLGFYYLALYNVAFVFPLIIVMLIMLTIRAESFSLIRWGEKEKQLRLFSGLVFIVLGLYMILIIL